MYMYSPFFSQMASKNVIWLLRESLCSWSGALSLGSLGQEIWKLKQKEEEEKGLCNNKFTFTILLLSDHMNKRHLWPFSKLWSFCIHDLLSSYLSKLLGATWTRYVICLLSRAVFLLSFDNKLVKIRGGHKQCSKNQPRH